jgi:hypothetical protein
MPLKLGFENSDSLEFNREEGFKLSRNADERNESTIKPLRNTESKRGTEPLFFISNCSPLA